MSTVTMQELEFETAELLPARETLTVCRHASSGGFSQVGYSNNAQAGLINVNALNGDFNNWFSIGSGNVRG